MKWLMILFSLYVLALSAVPCCGDDFCCDDEVAVLHKDGSHEEHGHNKPEPPCSPFFSCGMCHGVVVPEQSVLLEPEPLSGENLCFSYTAHFLSGYTAPIWQPPQAA